MDESAQAPAAAPAAGQSQTVEVPIAAIGEAKEGDTVTMKVISRDDQNGVANLAPVTGAPEPGGSDGLASDFDKDKMKGA